MCGQATPLSADAETAGGVITRLIEHNTTIPKDEASRQIDTKDGLENHCDQLVDDCGDVTLLMHKGTERRSEMGAKRESLKEGAEVAKKCC